MLVAGVNFGGHAVDMGDDDEPDDKDDELLLSSTTKLLNTISPCGYKQSAPSRSLTNYFYQSQMLDRGLLNQAPFPKQTFKCADNVVVHLSRDPPLKRMSVDDATSLFNLPDLRPALVDYLNRLRPDGFVTNIGGRRLARQDSELPFTHIEVWKKLRLQTKAYHFPHGLLSPVTINAEPPSLAWPQEHVNSVILNLDPLQKWPMRSIQGHAIADLVMVFRLIMPPPAFAAVQPPEHHVTDGFLSYVK
ncbi:hypothetical protein CPB83DRAFT_899162 [Crepidotus variabilis]|uniref:DUF6830 domain-containing protein n=1 Tax=Crepidotus variabilis TaxID=179855 RepID=A0A9P6JJH7_9AGAR|nr:hypothetical protein CPB83DRAFT_899162 [Crepidotus variabilis]